MSNPAELRLALEWFLNPDHLPFLVGIESGLYRKNGIRLHIIEPEGHYDGFQELSQGNLELAVNEPLHLVEEYRENIASIGNFFETEGGVIFTSQGYQKLLAGKPISVASPVSNPVTDTILRDILKRHLKAVGRSFAAKSCKVLEKDFYHIRNLKKGEADAAWLCFENFEGVEAEGEGLEIERLYLNKVGIPNFCALDLFASKTFCADNLSLIADFKQLTEQAIDILTKDYDYCKAVFYQQPNQEPSALMDAIIKDSFLRFLSPMASSRKKWQDLYLYVKENNISQLREERYNSLFLEVSQPQETSSQDIEQQQNLRP